MFSTNIQTKYNTRELANKINRIKLLNKSQKLFKSCTDFSILACNASNFDDHF
jgi:hypothetical protein